MTTSGAPVTARARVRAELTREIKAAARRQLAEVGAAALSLRAVARELNMASSAVYRYFPSRDELLTSLIVDAYASVGDAAAQAEAAVRRADRMGRWMATARAVRTWAVAHPQEYALIFGSPVPGYQAPPDTIDPAARIPVLLVSILDDSPETETGRTGRHPEAGRPMPRTVKADLRSLATGLETPLEPGTLGEALMAWVALIGLISFELFGHLNNVIHDYDAHFDFQIRGIALRLGIAPANRPAKTPRGGPARR